MGNNYFDKYNQFLKQVGSFGSPSASTFKMMSPFMKMGQGQAIGAMKNSPGLQQGITSAATYALNANPYYAGINAFTGGALDKGVGSVVQGTGKALGLIRNKAPDAGLVSQQANYAQMAMGQQDSLGEILRRMRRDEEEARQGLQNYETSARNLAMFGPSARDTAGMVASGMAPAQAAADAARANVSAGLSQRGISGGIAEGARAGVETGLAQAGAQVGTNVFNSLLERSKAMQDKAADLSANRLDTASTLGYRAATDLGEMPYRLEQLRIQEEANKQQEARLRREQRFEETQAIAKGLSDIGPDLFKLFQRGQGQTSTPATRNDSTILGQEYYANPEDLSDPYVSEIPPSERGADLPYEYSGPLGPSFSFDGRSGDMTQFVDPYQMPGGLGSNFSAQFGQRPFVKAVSPQTQQSLDMMSARDFMLQQPGAETTINGVRVRRDSFGIWRKQ